MWVNIIGPVKPSLRPLAMVEAHHLPGRLNIVADFESQRLAAGSVHLSGDQQQVGPLHNKSFCKQIDSTASQICELEARFRGRGSGCLYSGLEPAQGICILSSYPNRAMS